MSDVISGDGKAVSIPLEMPSGIGWDIMQQIVEADKLLRDSERLLNPACQAEDAAEVAENISLSRELLSSAAIKLSYILLPESGSGPADAGSTEQVPSRAEVFEL